MARRDGCWNGVSFGSHIQNVTKNCLKQTTRQAVNFERKTKSPEIFVVKRLRAES